MAGRSPLFSLVLVVAVAAAGWFLYQALQDGTAPAGDDLDVSILEVGEENRPAPTPAAPPRTELTSAPKPAFDRDDNEPPNLDAPTPPDRLRLTELVREEGPADQVLQEICGRTGHQLYIEDAAVEILGREMIGMEARNRRASEVLDEVLKPLGLKYEVDGKLLRIKTVAK